MSIEKLGDNIEEALKVTPEQERPKGHSLVEIYKEVSRLSAMNFFVQAVTEKYPGTTLYTLKENMEELAYMLINDNVITDTLAANLLQIEVEEVQEKFDAWRAARPKEEEVIDDLQ